MPLLKQLWKKMINIDTNILIRVFLQDNLDQAEKSQNLLKSTAHGVKIFISSYALLEFVWVLKIKKVPRIKIYEALMIICDTPGITVANKDIIITASEKFFKGEADFGDYMILTDGERNGAKNFKTFNQTITNEIQTASKPE